MDISIIILNYKSKKLVLNCIKSIKDADFNGLQNEIIVVDNGSNDGIGELIKWQYPEIIFIRNKSNLGMGAGNNVGIARARGKYIAVVNPDIVVYPDTFKNLYRFMEANPKAGAVGPRQLDPDGAIQDSCYRWYGLFTPLYRRTPLGRLPAAKKDLDRLLMKDFNHQNEKEVDWLLGSFLFCRVSALEKTGLFDERFFLYFEDTDLCRRFWENGFKVVYFPEARVIHNHIRESARAVWYRFWVNPAARHHISSWFKYLLKWGIKKYEKQ